MHVWLVQRGSFRDVAPSAVTGIDSLVRWHYMGSSEFEDGGLHGSLRRVVAELDQYAAEPSDIVAADDLALMVYCRRDRREAVLAAVRDLAMEDRRAPRLKEPARLKSALAGGPARSAELWWDIENDWMAWLGADRPVARAIEAVAARWRMRT